MVGGAPDYMKAAIEETDVLIQEGPGWDKRMARRFQEVANGSYAAFKEALEGVERQKHVNPEVGAWNEFYYKALYESGVRVGLADYPKGHPNVTDELGISTAIHGRDQILGIYAKRDRYMLASTVEKISELRRMVPDIQSKSPLRVLMIFGAAHYAVHDALVAAAEEQGVTPYSSRLLFQESADFVSPSITPQERAKASQLATDYQNWLRTPED
jgi:hypothetical protein